MESFFEFILRSAISLIVLYVFYWFVLRNDTHFHLNRVYLVCSLIISLLIPILHNDILRKPALMSNIPALIMDLGSNTHTLQPQGSKAAAASSIGLLEILALIYLTGALIVFGRLIYQAIFIHALTRLSAKSQFNGYTVVRMHSDTTPFSYFKRIFIPAEKLDEHSLGDIIAHEQSHLVQGHFVDLFLIEAMTVLQWFNPFVWLFEKSIKETHEYLADEAVISSGSSKGRYQALMVNQAMGGPVFILTNQFNQSLLKKRMMMMKKMKTPQVAKLKVLLVLPLIAGLILAFSSPKESCFWFNAKGNHHYWSIVGQSHP